MSEISVASTSLSRIKNSAVHNLKESQQPMDVTLTNPPFFIILIIEISSSLHKQPQVKPASHSKLCCRGIVRTAFCFTKRYSTGTLDRKLRISSILRHIIHPSPLHPSPISIAHNIPIPFRKCLLCHSPKTLHNQCED